MEFNNIEFDTAPKKKNLVPLIAVLVVIFVLAAAVGFYYWQKVKTPAASAPSQTSASCTAGSGNACPLSTSTQQTAATSSSATTSSTITIPSSWETYKNNTYGFQFKYPPALVAVENPKMSEAYVFSVSFENVIREKQASSTKIISFNVTLFKNNAQLQSGFRNVSLDNEGQVMIGGVQAEKLFSPKGRAVPFTSATVYQIFPKSMTLIFYGSDYSGLTDKDVSAIISTFKFFK